MMRFNGDWLLLPQRFAIHEPSATAVLADVHLGYSAARQRQGDAIPARSVMEEMQPLLDAARLHPFRNLIVAGDLFERGFDEAIAQQFLAVLDRLNVRFVGLVPGNHDHGADRAPSGLPIFSDGCDLAGWRIVHGDRPGGAGIPACRGRQECLPHGGAGIPACRGRQECLPHEPKVVMGHWHPAQRRQRRKAPCFLLRGTQLILPAFSLDAAGVDVGMDGRWKDWARAAIVGNEVVGMSTTSRKR